MIEFRCINAIRQGINLKGMKQEVIEYTLKNGKRGTEIVTNLDFQGNKGIRDIQRNIYGEIEKVVDDTYGRHEEYVSAYPYYSNSIFQYDKEGKRTLFRNVTLESLCRNSLFDM